MKLMRKLCFILVSCLLMFSCVSSKRDFLRRLDNLVDNVQKNHDRFSERDWRRVEIRLDRLNTMLIKRYHRNLTEDEKNLMVEAADAYASYRNSNNGEIPPPPLDNNDLAMLRDENRKLIQELEALQKQFLENQRNVSHEITGGQRTKEEALIEKLENDYLMKALSSARAGRRAVTGKVKVLIIPTIFKGNAFHLNPSALSPIIEESISIIVNQAKKYHQNISIDWEYVTRPNGSYIAINDSSEALYQHAQYKNSYRAYDHLVLVYAVDMEGRSYCTISGPLGRSEANAIVLFKDPSGHSPGVLAHEIFHTFGAEDLYYEAGVVPQEVELHFKTLLGNSIMITSRGTAGLDPINAWLIGWNKNPEPWYIWFVDRRNNSVDVGLNLTR